MIDLIYLVFFSIIVSIVVGLFFRRPSFSRDPQTARKRLRDSIFGDLADQTDHSFHYVDLFDKPTYSSTSGQPLFGGQHCDKCGICVGSDERREASTYLKCKPLYIDDDELEEANTPSSIEPYFAPDNEPSEIGSSRDHHFVAGNLPLLSKCTVCGQPAGHEPKLVDFCCSLCHRAVHQKCLGLFLASMASRFCDLGSLARFAIPPWCVRVRRSGASATRLLKGKRGMRISLSRICAPSWHSSAVTADGDDNKRNSTWQPLFVFANRLSGSGDAEAVLHAFRLHLNPSCQIFDLAVYRDPAQILAALNDLLPSDVHSFIVLVAGGDGTVRSIADAVCQLSDAFASRHRKPQIAILPLGTGNDLARVLGLGGGHVGTLDVVDYLSNGIKHWKSIQLDRWKVEIERLDKNSGFSSTQGCGVVTRSSKMRLAAISSWQSHLPAMIRPSSSKSTYVYNYISIGADALVTLSFSQRRDLTPWLCNSRLVNKLIYGIYGLVDMLQRECHDLYKYLRLKLDDRVIEELPEIEALIFLNIGSWGGGCRLLELGGADGVNSETASRKSSSSSVSSSSMPALDGFSKEQEIDDGIIEVVGVYSSMHMAQLMAGFGSPVRIGQAKQVTIELLKRFPIQVDGEAWKQSPARIKLSWCNQVTFLASDESI